MIIVSLYSFNFHICGYFACIRLSGIYRVYGNKAIYLIYLSSGQQDFATLKRGGRGEVKSLNARGCR